MNVCFILISSPSSSSISFSILSYFPKLLYIRPVKGGHISTYQASLSDHMTPSAVHEAPCHSITLAVPHIQVFQTTV